MINWRGKRGSTCGQNVLYAYMEFSINFSSLPKKTQKQPKHPTIELMKKL